MTDPAVARSPFRRVAAAGSLALALAISALASVPVARVAGPAARPAAGPADPARRAVRSLGRLPVRFEPAGAEGGRYSFVTRGAANAVWLSSTGATFVGRRPAGGGRRGRGRGPAELSMELVGSRRGAAVDGSARLAGTTNYLMGNDPARWRLGVAGYRRVRAHGVYPGTDLVWHGGGQGLEYDFELAPGARPEAIAVAFPGAGHVRIDRAGALVVTGAGGHLLHHRPVAYQRVGGAARQVPARWVLHGRTARLGVGRYDRTRPLVIDPTLVYASYLGGTHEDKVAGVAVDGSGVYLAGTTTSGDVPGAGRSGDPLTSNDAFVTRLKPDGSGLVWSTYLGTTDGDDQVTAGLAVSGGKVYLAGSTNSSDFPGAGNARRGAYDAFVTVLPTGGPGPSQPPVSAYYGGSASDVANAVGLKPRAGAEPLAVLAGSTWSEDLATSSNAYTRTCAMQCFSGDAFVAELDPAGSPPTVGYATYLGGDSNRADAATGVAVGAGGDLFVTGTTEAADFPTRNCDLLVTCRLHVGPFASNMIQDAFVARLHPGASTGDASLVYSLYLGGQAAERSPAIAADAAGRAYVTGQTKSEDFPNTAGALARHGACLPPDPRQPASPPPVSCGSSSYLVVVAPNGAGPLYATTLGGSHSAGDGGAAVVVREEPSAPVHVYVTGLTDDPHFPQQGSSETFGDGFLTRFDITFADPAPATVTLASSTYLGSNRSPRTTSLFRDERDAGNISSGLNPAPVRSLAVGPDGDAYVAGSTVEAPLDNVDEPPEMPTVAPYQSVPASNDDGFVLRVRAAPTDTPVVSGVSPRGALAAGGARVVITGTGLGSARAVSFGGVPAAVVSAADTRIEVVVPPHAPGHVSVQVTAAGAASPPSTLASFTYAGGPFVRTDDLPVPHADDEHTTTDDAYPGDHKLRGATVTALPDGRVLVAGGAIRGVAGAPAEVFDPVAGTWARVDDMWVPRRGHAAALLTGVPCRSAPAPGWCGKVLVSGGKGFDGRAVSSAELFDPASGHWSQVAAMNEARHQPATAVLESGRVLVAGGNDTSTAQLRANPLATAEVYDPGADSWTVTEEMVEPHMGATATLLTGGTCDGATRPGYCGKVLVVGGITEPPRDCCVDLSPPAGAELFDPADLSWASTRDPIKYPRSAHTATRLVDGRVLVVGGVLGNRNDPSQVTATAELYDPGTGVWTDTGSSHSDNTRGLSGRPRYGHAAVLLATGDVLVVGGADRSDPHNDRADVPMASAEIYHPTTGGFDAVAGSLDTPRWPASAVVASSGSCGPACRTVLVLGGTYGTSAETYVVAPPAVAGLAPDHGAAAGGTLVTLTGAGLDYGPPTVRFGGAPAEVRSVAAGSVTVVAPPGSPDAAAPVTVDNAAGTASAGPFHYESQSPSTSPIEPGPPPDGAGCGPLPAAGPGQVALPGGYSLLGAPAGSLTGSVSPLYTWADQGAGGAYRAFDRATPVASGTGYWAWSPCPRVVILSGPGSDRFTTSLGAYHASMLANPSGRAGAVASGYDFAVRWDPTANGGAGGYHLSGYRENQSLAVGEGLWVFAYEATQVVIETRG